MLRLHKYYRYHLSLFQAVMWDQQINRSRDSCHHWSAIPTYHAAEAAAANSPVSGSIATLRLLRDLLDNNNSSSTAPSIASSNLVQSIRWLFLWGADIWSLSHINIWPFIKECLQAHSISSSLHSSCSSDFAFDSIGIYECVFHWSG